MSDYFYSLQYILVRSVSLFDFGGRVFPDYSDFCCLAVAISDEENQ